MTAGKEEVKIQGKYLAWRMQKLRCRNQAECEKWNDVLGDVFVQAWRENEELIR